MNLKKEEAFFSSYLFFSYINIEGTTSINSPFIQVIAAVAGSVLILIVGTTILVIGVRLIVKRKRHTPTVQYTEDSNAHIYEDVGAAKLDTVDTKVYEDVANRMDDTLKYATIN